MANQISTQTISFNNQSLITVEQNGNHYVAMKPICENIGLAWEPQVLRIKRDEVLSQGMIVMITPTNGGNQNMICLPIEYLNGWLFGIDINRCKPEIRDTLIKYKKECYQALHDYWFNGKAERKTTVDDRTGLRNAVNMLVSKKGLIYSDAYHLIHQRFNVESIEDLTLEQLPQAVEYVHKIILEGELITDVALPELKPKTYTIEMTENDITVLLWLWFIAVRVIGSLKMLVKPLKLLQAPIAPEVVSQAHEYPFTVEHARRILLKMSKDLEADLWRDDNLSRVLPKIRNFNESDLAYPGERR
jgi:putative antirepressor protein|nr:MAG TPA: repressor domain protein [Caudoviricetes sp.]